MVKATIAPARSQIGPGRGSVITVVLDEHLHRFACRIATERMEVVLLPIGSMDDEVYTRAEELGAVIVTCDHHFREIHRAYREAEDPRFVSRAPSVVHCRHRNPEREGLYERIKQAAETPGVLLEHPNGCPDRPKKKSSRPAGTGSRPGRPAP